MSECKASGRADLRCGREHAEEPYGSLYGESVSVDALHKMLIIFAKC